MNFRNLTLTACFIAAFLTTVTAQDIHFTQFYNQQQGLNPALAGNFAGTVRLSGIYREQWRSVIGSGRYTTPGVGGELNIRGLRKRDWIGIGISAFRDETGSLSLQHTGGRLGASYHLALDKKGQSVLAIGFTAMSENRKLNITDARFLDGYELDPNYGQGSAQQITFTTDAKGGTEPLKTTSYNIGATIDSKLNKQTDLQLGFSLNNFNRPDFTLLKQDTSSITPAPTQYRLPRRALLHGKFPTKLNKKTTLTPAFMFQSMGGQREIQLHGIVGYLFDEKKDIELQAGLGYRLRDAPQLFIGGKKKDLQVGLAYDVNTSKLVSESNFRGGWEMSATYIFRIYKPPVSKPKILCPRF